MYKHVKQKNALVVQYLVEEVCCKKCSMLLTFSEWCGRNQEHCDDCLEEIDEIEASAADFPFDGEGG